MDKPHGISLCMIVKNEQQRIADCLDAVDLLVDEKIVVDTGSTDETIHIATAHGAQIINYQWNFNTAAARNTGLRAANFEWILVLDADETIDKSDFVTLKNLIQKIDIDGIILSQRNYINDPEVENWRPVDGSYPQEADFAGYFDINVIRLFRNRSDILYTGHAHELVEESLKERNKVNSGVPIHHFGLAQGRVSSKEKNEHYLSLLLNDFNENPEAFKPNFLLGRQYFQIKQYEKSIFHLRKATSIRPNDPSAFNCLGMALLMTKNIMEAIPCFQQAISLNPTYEEPYYSLAVSYTQLNELQKAIGQVRLFLKINPKGVKGWNLLGFIYLQQGLYEMAQKQLEQALQLHPQYNLSRGNLIQALLLKGNIDNAYKEAEILANNDPASQTWIDQVFAPYKK